MKDTIFGVCSGWLRLLHTECEIVIKIQIRSGACNWNVEIRAHADQQEPSGGRRLPRQHQHILGFFGVLYGGKGKLFMPSPIYHRPTDECLFTRCLGVLFTVVPVPACLRVAAMMTAPSWDQLQRQDRLNQTFRHAPSLELQTKVHMKVRNHREGSYNGLLLVESTY